MTTTTSTDVPEVADVVDTYLSMWNETDGGRRHELIERAWAPAGRYADPLQEAEGHTALSEMAAAIQGHYPGHTFRRTSGVDVHHDGVRFDWELAGPDGSVVVAGLDVGVLDADGRLRSIIGFFGPTPPLAGA
jgi:hypothetical protein